MRIFSAIYIVIAFFMFTTLAYSAVPSTVTHQGYLEASGGGRVNGPVNMGFAIYSVETGGTALWTEAQTVQVLNGIYAVALGAVNPIDPAIIDGDLWLGVTVGTDSEMMPRQKLGAVPFALKAEESNSDAAIYYHWGNSTCPTGSELVYSGIAGQNQWGGYGASKAICLNVYGGVQGPSGGGSYFAPIKYNITVTGIGELSAVDGDVMPCAVCNVSSNVVFMQPGNNVCPGGYTSLYNGFLMARVDSEPVCVEGQSPEGVTVAGGYNWLVLAAEQDFGAGMEGTALSCAVCSEN